MLNFLRLCGVALLVVVLPLPLSTEHDRHQDSLVIWRTDKGEWITWIQKQSCDHFSMGKIKTGIQQVMKSCALKKNRLWLSTSSPEHIPGVRSWMQKAELCLAHSVTDYELERLPPNLNLCSDLGGAEEIEVFKTTPDRVRRYYPRRIFYAAKNKFLILGDFLQKDEELVNKQLGARGVKYLSLAHHGRNSALPKKLKRFLKEKTLAVVSDIGPKGKSRMGKKLRQKLHRSGIPLIETSLWGNLILKLTPRDQE